MLWKDRVPTRANRKKITFEDESLGTKYATVEYADEPTEQGTPLNRANMLKGFNNFVCGVLPTSATDGTITVDLGFEPYFILVFANTHPNYAQNVAEFATYCDGKIYYGTVGSHHLEISVSGTTLTVSGPVYIDGDSGSSASGSYIAFKHPAFE